MVTLLIHYLHKKVEMYVLHKNNFQVEERLKIRSS